MDGRWTFERGDKVRILEGPYRGLEGVIDETAEAGAGTTGTPEAMSEPPPPIELEAVKPATFYALINKRDIFNSAPPPAPAIPKAA